MAKTYSWVTAGIGGLLSDSRNPCGLPKARWGGGL